MRMVRRRHRPYPTDGYSSRCEYAQEVKPKRLGLNRIIWELDPGSALKCPLHLVYLRTFQKAEHVRAIIVYV